MDYGLYLPITYQLPITIYYNDGWIMAMDYYMDYYGYGHGINK